MERKQFELHKKVINVKFLILEKNKNFNLDENGFCVDSHHYGDGDLFDDNYKNKYFPLMANYLKKIESKKSHILISIKEV